LNFHLHILMHTHDVLVNFVYACESCRSPSRMVSDLRISGLSEAGKPCAKVVPIRLALIYYQRTLDKIF
jgi:hypothetical protein